jgi:hypothetical protein
MAHFFPKQWNDRTYLADRLSITAEQVESFPNHLRAPKPEAGDVPKAGRTLLLLVVCALLPRLAMAWLIPTICNDGALYVSLAELRGQGNIDESIVHINNLYPRILHYLHSAGLPWEVAGKLWGVLCGTLVVLPLFGWVRRQFNDRVAVVSCLVYAVQSELIEWSPEIIRDQTFWLLFTSALYFIWRAIVEVRVPFHLAAAGLTALSILSRFEGVFLVIPYGLWGATRFYSLHEGRRRLILGYAAVGLLPLAAFLIAGDKSTASQTVSRWLYVEPWQRFQAWWSNAPKPTETAAATATAAIAERTAATPSLPYKAWRYLRTIFRGMTELTCLLIFIGFALHARLALRSDHLPIMLVCLAVAGAIWIHMWYSGGEASSRYSLVIVILGARCAAIGLMRITEAVARRLVGYSLAIRRAAILAPTALLCIIGCCDALTTQFDSRIGKAELGRWIRRTYGEKRVIAGPDSQLPIVGFYAGAAHQTVSSQDVNELVGQIRQISPDIVLLPAPRRPSEQQDALVKSIEGLGMSVQHPDPTVSYRDKVVVLAREPLRR